MKNFKKAISKVISMTLAVMLVAALGVPVGASASLPDLTRKGSITVHKLAVDPGYQGVRGTGAQLSGSTIVGKDKAGENVKLEDLDGLADISFTLERVKPKETTPGTVDVPVVWEVDSTFTMVTKTTPANGTIVFDNLDLGTYKVTELPNPAVPVAHISAPTYIQIPMDDPSTPTVDDFMYDVHMYPKNNLQGPDIDKSVSFVDNKDDTIDLTEQVKWIVRTEIPTDVATSTKYNIVDNLASVFRYVADSLEVSYIDGATGTKTTLASPADYTLTVNTNGKTAYPWQDDMLVSLTAAGRTKIAAAYDPSEPAPEKMPKLTLEFKTRFDIPQDVLEGYLTNAIENQATLNYTNIAGKDYDNDSEKPEVHTGGVKLKKVDQKGTVLEGASFKIYKSEADALAGTNAMKDPANTANDWVVTSGSDGIVNFYGLAYAKRATGSDAAGAGDVNNTAGGTKYWIVETKAPTGGYTLLNAPIEVTCNITSHLATNAVTVINSKFDLPLTGGTGMALVIAVGIALIGTGAAFYFFSKKKSQAN